MTIHECIDCHKPYDGEPDFWADTPHGHRLCAECYNALQAPCSANDRRVFVQFDPEVRWGEGCIGHSRFGAVMVAEYERTVDAQPKQSRSTEAVASVVARLAFADEAEVLLRRLTEPRWVPDTATVTVAVGRIRSVLGLLQAGRNEPDPMHDFGIICGTTAMALFDRARTRDTTQPLASSHVL